MLHRFLFVALAFALACADVGAAAVELFSPQGEVASVRQVTARFDEQMVEFGDPRATDPFDLSCAEKGAGRWIDGRNWSYDFDRDLPAGIRCEFTLKPGLKTLKGAVVPAKSFTFNTGGPKLVRSWPARGTHGIKEEQSFLVELNVPAREASVRDLARCAIKASSEEMPIVLLAEAEVRALEKQHHISPKDTRPRLALRCAKPLPVNAAVDLVWSKSIASQSGVTSRRDQLVDFVVRPPFGAGHFCNERQATGGCNPSTTISVSFSGAVPQAVAELARLKMPDGALRAPDPLPDLPAGVHNISWTGPYPENSDVVITLPPDLRDEDRRPLSNAKDFPKTVRIGEPAPAIRFAARVGVIERNAGGILPVTLQNVEDTIPVRSLRVGAPKAFPTDDEIIEWTARFHGSAYHGNSKFARASFLSDTPGVESAVLRRRLRGAASENVPIELKRPGYYVVEVESARMAPHHYNMPYVRAIVLVTNLAVHFKHGPENALAWVTRLDTGEPVAEAAVAVRDCHGGTIWEGKSDPHGLARIDRALPERQTCASGFHGFLVSARTADDLGFTLTQWTYHSQTPMGKPTAGWDGYFPRAGPGSALHTVFDRTLFRAGETVHMKHYARRETLAGLALPGDAGTASAEIEHASTRTRFTVPVAWTADGTGTTTWTVPGDAKLGTYVVRLSAPGLPAAASGSFRVEEFRLPTMRAELRSDAPQYFNVADVPYRLRLAYLAGGPSQQTVTLRTRLAPHRARFEGFEDFAFAGPVYWQPGAPPVVLEPMRIELNEQGEARPIVKGIPRRDAPTEMTAEMEFADASGEIQTVSSVTRLWPAAIVLGMNLPRRPAAVPADQDIHAVALDLDGNMLPDTAVRVEMFARTRRTQTTLGPDGRERVEQIVDDKPLGEVCSGRTDSRGMLRCSANPPRTRPGEIAFKASATDASGNVARMELATYVFPPQQRYYGPPSQATMVDLYPDRIGYRPGDTARIQLEVPYDRTRVLVTVEREGVAESRVQELDAGTRELEIPIRATYAPNVYVSVLMVNGRRGKGRATQDGDPDKPVFFHGLRELRVAPLAYAMTVQVVPDREVYAPRQSASVQIRARLADGSPARNAEVALAAVDEALLQLLPNASWRLLESVLKRRAVRVQSATAVTQIIGERAFADAVAGGLAMSQARPQAKPAPAPPMQPEDTGPPRELFDTLLKWQARIRLDDKGEAAVDVPLNDSLTAFRIVALAHADADQFGVGETLVRSTTALAILAGLPPLVREGDAYRAMATLRNTGVKPMRIEFSAKAQGSGPGGITAMPATTLNVDLKAGEAREVSWPVAVPVNTGLLTWELAARNASGPERDLARITQKVVVAVPVTVQQATLTQLEKPIEMQVALPGEAIPGRGGVAIALRAKLGDGLDSVRRYMSRYPYSCLEQKISRAVALQDEAEWRRTVAALESYVDQDGLVRYYPDPSMPGSETLTTYVLAVAHEARWTLPPQIRLRMINGLRAFVEGRVVRQSWTPRADLEYRLLAAIEALSRHGLAQPQMLDRIHVDPNAWPTSAVLDWLQIHQRNRNFPKAEATITEAQQIVRSRLNLQGTTMGFSTESTDFLWWLMVSPDLNAVRAVIALLDDSGWREDIPRMVRGALQRQRGGHWLTTTANAWGVLAMRNFSQRFEAVAVTGQTRAALGERSAVQDWPTKAGSVPLQFDWPRGAGTLRIDHQGSGKPWATIQSLAAVPLKAPFSSGYRIVKRVEAVQRRTANAWSRGDVLRVTLELEAQSDMTHVVVSDPIPAGSSILGSGLGRDSKIATAADPQRVHRYWRAPFEERTFETYRAYYTFVPKGRWTAQYTLGLNNDGRFELPQTRAEAMYAPEMFGELPNAAFSIRP